VLVLRDVTERQSVESGCAEVVGTKRTKILEHATAWLEGAGQRPPVSRGNPFGDGRPRQNRERATTVSRVNCYQLLANTTMIFATESTSRVSMTSPGECA